MKTIVTFLLISISLTSTCFAGYYNVGKLCAVQSNNGWAYISPCTTWSSVAGNSGGWISFELDVDDGEIKYSTALAAYLNDKNIRVLIDENNSANTYDYTTMIRIY